MYLNKFIRLLIFFSFTIVLLSACKKKESQDTMELKMLANSYAKQLDVSMSDFRSKTQSLDTKLDWFYDNMIGVNYQYVKDSWIEMHNEYSEMGPFLYANASINPFISFNNSAGLLVTNPSYIDQTLADATSGIIPNSTAYPDLTSTVLANAHLSGSNENVALGIYALEFIIWGEDNNSAGPGARIPFDYENFGTSTKARRKEYLRLVDYAFEWDLADVDLDAFKTNFYNLDPEKSLEYMLSGFYRFVKNDFAHKTIKQPYDNPDQKYEESQFADNTVSSIEHKILSVRNFLYGDLFDSSNGYFLMDYIKLKEPELHAEIDGLVVELENTGNLLTLSFDNGINTPSERSKYLSLYNILIELSDAISQFASSQGLTNL